MFILHRSTMHISIIHKSDSYRSDLSNSALDLSWYNKINGKKKVPTSFAISSCSYL